MAVSSAINDFFQGIYELFASIFGAAYAVVHSIFSAIASFITGIFSLVTDVLSGLIDVTGGVGKFIASNIVLISVGAIGAFAYFQYTAQGRRQIATKKTS